MENPSRPPAGEIAGRNLGIARKMVKRASFRAKLRGNGAFCTSYGRQATAVRVPSAGPILHSRRVRPYDPIQVTDDGAHINEAGRAGVVLSLIPPSGAGASHISAPLSLIS